MAFLSLYPKVGLIFVSKRATILLSSKFLHSFSLFFFFELSLAFVMFKGACVIHNVNVALVNYDYRDLELIQVKGQNFTSWFRIFFLSLSSCSYTPLVTEPVWPLGKQINTTTILTEPNARPELSNTFFLIETDPLT